MKTTSYFLLIFFNLLCGFLNGNQPKEEHSAIEGFWKTINEKTMKPESVIGIYQYQGQYFGRIILTYHEDGTIQDTIYQPKKRAPGIPGNPYYVGLDIIWGLKQEGNKFKKGNVLDPEKGHVYGAEAWKEGEDLILRGKLLMFGRNQKWPRATDGDFPENFKKPDLASFIPVIPSVK